MLKKFLLPMNLSKTPYTEWETIIEPDYTSYTIEAIHGYILNQIFINEGDVIELEVNLRTIIEIDTSATSANFKGFRKTTIEGTDGYNEDDWYYLGETLEKADDLFYCNFKVYKLIAGNWTNITAAKYFGTSSINPALVLNDYDFYIAENDYLMKVWNGTNPAGFPPSVGNWIEIDVGRPLLKIIMSVHKQINNKLYFIDKLKTVKLDLFKTINNEFVESTTNNEPTKFKHQPDPFMSTTDEINDKTKKYFTNQSIENKNPLTFNNTVTAVRQKEKFAIQNIKGSSLYAQFINFINLNLAGELYDYWIRSYNISLGGIYYRTIGIIKFCSIDSNYTDNFLTTIRYDGERQIINTSYGTTNHLNNELPALAIVDNLKLGDKDTRLLYPVSVIASTILSHGMFIYYRNLLIDDGIIEPQKAGETDDSFYVRCYPIVCNNYRELTGNRIAATRGISYIMFSRNIGEGTTQSSRNSSKCIIYNKQLNESFGSYNCNSYTYGFFNLWSPQLYVTVDDVSDLSVVSNVQNENATAINNVVYVFYQTSQSFSWSTNGIEHKKIPITSNRKLRFTLKNFAGDRIPLEDTSTGLRQQLLLEINQYIDEKKNESG